MRASHSAPLKLLLAIRLEGCMRWLELASVGLRARDRLSCGCTGKSCLIVVYLSVLGAELETSSRPERKKQLFDNPAESASGLDRQPVSRLESPASVWQAGYVLLFDGELLLVAVDVVIVASFTMASAQ